MALSQTGNLEVAPAGSKIVKLGIYPSIGICRLGNSSEWFFAPEVPGLPPRPEGGFKDRDQRVKKQVQRFRIYGFDSEGRVVSEITTDNAEIEWTVHVANTKAAWYQFSNPLDIPDLASGLPGQRRNQAIADSDREKMLVIDPGPTSISGPDKNKSGGNEAYQMACKFWDSIDVSLGELRTDKDGRLLVFPGNGKSDSAIPDNAIKSFSGNDAWYDDTCDGWVKAKVKLADGTELPVEPGWVVSTAPNFAPEITPFISLHDVVRDTMVKKGHKNTQPTQEKLSFRRDIYPYFYRLGLMEWVAASASLRQGWIDIGDFLDPKYLTQLADPSPENKAFRTKVFKQFRDPKSEKIEQYKLPYLLGEGVNYDFSPAQWFLIPDLQYTILQRWADGDFTNDYQDDALDKLTAFDEIDLALQPDALTRAALEPCSGGAFHPGVELTWPMRHEAMYASPFRIALGNRSSLIHDVGPLLTQDIVFKGSNEAPPPVGAQMPGDLTRWMGVPWQCDAFSCNQVMYENDFPNATWWPAQMPVDVLPEAYYNQIMRKDLSPEQRIQFAENRVPWARGAAGLGYHAEASYLDGLARMIYLWHRMGFIVSQPGPTDEAAPSQIPKVLFVESERGSMKLEPHRKPNTGLK